MKKNMLSVLILALLVVNVALTAIMMFTMMGTTKKTSRLIDGISAALSLEIADPNAPTEEAKEEVSMEDLEVYKIEDQMTIGLAKGADGESHFCLVSVSLTIDKTSEDYAKYQPLLATNEDMIKGKIYEVIGRHPIEEAESNQDGLRQEILDEVKAMYGGSDFIYNVVFRDIMFQ